MSVSDILAGLFSVSLDPPYWERDVFTSLNDILVGLFPESFVTTLLGKSRFVSQ